MTAPLSVRNLTKRFDALVAVDDVSFDLREGEVLALIGPNGAGKSTCFNMLNGQLRPTAGSIKLLGREIAGLPPRKIARLGVGRTFQITATFASMTVRENVQMALIAQRRRAFDPWSRANRFQTEEADRLLALVALSDEAERPCAELAYGDLKRLELAVALAGSPRLLLMDEPTAGMAPAERHALMELVARIVRERAISVLFTEHDMDVVFAFAQRLLVLDRGRLIAEGTPKEIRENAEVRAVYLGGAPVAPASAEAPADA
ncbi:ABC transporter ATP-binding protein [Consotaella aegiceratis]|uniref:ABC transporter ATP-binding protein n=1 Tax=Consotaella aegiceratis TaxID=3097961 RepID=UPI002F3F8625